jgi:hypothetical protein
MIVLDQSVWDQTRIIGRTRKVSRSERSLLLSAQGSLQATRIFDRDVYPERL